MPEPADNAQPHQVEVAKKAPLEPRGLVTLGDIDPRTLTKEQFTQQSGILYHGTTKSFNFRQEYDYRSEEYYTGSDGSQTLGEGFYTTDNLTEAENYSRVRRGNQSASTVTLQMLPYQARMLDLRAKTYLSRNAPMPKDLFERWKSYYLKYYKSTSRDRLPWYITSSEEKYFSYLDEISQLPEIDIRVMLETAPHPQVDSRNLPSPPWMRLFANFMQKEGFDGLVYNEGGEGLDSEGNTSFVFYNLKKIGTYEAWKNEIRTELTTLVNK